MRFHSVAVAMMIGTAAHAGTAFDQEITCPVGGEVFEIVSTASCSSRGVRYMNFRPQSSCEFVTKLPVCPSNGLPMFQEFDESQVTYLEKVIETPAYKDVQTLPKWHRAYILAHWMDLTQSDTGFNLLLNAMWNDPTSFVSDPNMVDSMLFEAEAQFARSDRENKPYVAAIVAFGMLQANRTSEAQRWLTRAQDTKGADNFVGSYIAAVRACIGRMQAPECSPNATFGP